MENNDLIGVPKTENQLRQVVKPAPDQPVTRFEKIVRTIIIGVLLFSLISFVVYALSALGIIKLPSENVIVPNKISEFVLTKFESQEDFQNYLKRSSETSFFSASLQRLEVSRDSLVGSPAMGSAESMAPQPTRVSSTNIQVVGIDEPDILKNDGQHLYYSAEENWFGRPLPVDRSTSDIIAPDFKPPAAGKTRIISAIPDSELTQVSAIDKTGELFLSDGKLSVFTNTSLITYDITDKSDPKSLWTYTFGSKNRLLDARLSGETIYLVLETQVSSSNPCPFNIRENENVLTIPCTDIYHPSVPVPVSATFSVVSLSAKDGTVNDSVTFVGSAGNSVVYMSKNALYVSYPYTESLISYTYGFLSEKANDLVPQTVIEKLSTLLTYDLSEQSKLTEMSVILEEFTNSLTDNERLKVQNELQDRMSDYTKERTRVLEKTGLVKINTESLDITATNAIPGVLLNQFAVDEHEGFLRVATTVGNSGNFFADGESANDVYILDNSLNITGSVIDMGISERIYSVRFIGTKGYVVTFRQIDPFYILDLSDPRNPKKTGELKIPGYSSYLHPLSEEDILGVGVEGGRLKLTIFNVSDTQNPKETDTYNLDEYGSEALQNHHAFLLDDKHKVFFIPGNQGGYIFSFRNNELELVKAISGYQIERATYINDTMFVLGRDNMTALDENDWTEKGELIFEE